MRLRLCGFAICLVGLTFPQGFSKEEKFPHIVWRSFVPIVVVTLAAALCAWHRTKKWWRQVVMGAAVLTYNSILWADVTEPLHGWSSCQKDYNTMLQLVWLLFMYNVVALFFALDMIQVAQTLSCIWLSYIAGSIAIYARWYEATNRGWTWAMREIDLPVDRIEEGQTEAYHTRVLPVCLALSFVGWLLMLMAVRRLNRFERQVFVNSFVLTNRVERQMQQIERKQVELLALFSNPRVPMSAPVQLRPLQLGQELKYLLRSLGLHVVVEPAASLQDVERAVEAHDPRILHFSGHSWMGSLAFESSDGRIEVPPPHLFIDKIRQRSAPRLHCVFLNGCETAELGFQIATQLPYVMVVCWATITEDAAARAFAQGFYDAVGGFLAADERVQVRRRILAPGLPRPSR